MNDKFLLTLGLLLIVIGAAQIHSTAMNSSSKAYGCEPCEGSVLMSYSSSSSSVAEICDDATDNDGDTDVDCDDSECAFCLICDPTVEEENCNYSN